MSNTTNWVNFPVSVDGVEFISKIDKDGSFYPQLVNLPSEVFQQFHADMIHTLIGNPSLMTREELEDELEVVNAGASQAILALA
jgi:hypothetical protein